MSRENQEAQEDELLALSSIYPEDEFRRTDTSPGGEIQVCLELPPNFRISVKCNSASNTMESFENTVSFLPPIVLDFEFPPGYPSTTCPIFTLSCKWLSPEQLTLMCQRLDDLWEANRGSVILFAWMQFLKEETLEYLNIKSPYEVQFINNGTHTFMEVEEEASLCIAAAAPEDEASLCNAAAAPEKYASLCNAAAAPEKEAGLCNAAAAPEKESGLCIAAAAPEEEASLCNAAAAPEKEASLCIAAAAPEEEAVDRRAIQDVQSVYDLIRHILDFDESQQKKCFDSKQFLCNICFSEKLGCECTYFKDCNHVYCDICLRDYFEIQIRDGQVHALNCPEPECTSVATPAQVKKLVGEELFVRYDRLLLKSTLEMMTDVVYCPRLSCQTPVMQEPGGTMGICTSCQYAFCTLCMMTYHGVSKCKASESMDPTSGEPGPKRNRGKIGRLRKLREWESKTWITENCKKCPRCDANIQKDSGCNKMACGKCGQYFCWICMKCLSETNPYSHYINSACTQMS
ncbi:E3 ubiquitin-protein ligase RNF14-like isoform X2 [Rana temporaria]|uniref:E3 ubiquitin-protein ligase RNF14-like isoform X2 n=1 Tax=Rana temporaria TaxID=8407 RepID=UPI001AACEDF2|nr:E3 ubiquitin-protein ligase RNF14-like isoform X2 [Rana temporaria]